MRLTQTSVFEILSWALPPDGAWTLVDAGAHHGEFSRRLGDAFPAASIHAFEPAPNAYNRLASRELPRVHAWNAAVGDTNGPLPFRVNQGDETSSFLAPNANAAHFHGEAHRAQRLIQAQCVRLDDWAIQQRIGPVHAIKLDVQGAEVAALRGADRLLRDSVLAVYSEAQFIPEYDRASAFGDVDRELVARGFSLFQIVDVQPKGPLLETASCDAIWLRSDVVHALRASPPRTHAADDAARFGAVFAELAQRDKVIAIYGAGTHTRTRLIHALAECPARVVCVIDDALEAQGKRLWGFPVVSQEGAVELGVNAVVLSSDLHEHLLLERCRPLRDAGVEVVCLYGADRARPATPSPRAPLG